MRRGKIKVMTILIFGLMVGLVKGGAETGSPGQEGIKLQKSEQVQIGPNCVIMPLERIVLVHKDSQYCAIKFTEAWTGETRDDRFANYESYFQGDGTGDFSKSNVQSNRDQLAARRRVGLGRLWSHPAGPENKQIKCGPIKLAWSGWGTVYFNDRTWWKSGDHGIELAPTKWTDISQVNVFDTRLKWYRYDGKRKNTFIPIDELW